MTIVVHSPTVPTTRRGRPRSIERHRAILETTRDLLTAGSYEQLTMDDIATGAGVSKPTLYKWWPSKAAIVTEAIIAGYLSTPSVSPEDTGDVAADLGAWLRARLDEAADPASSALIRAMTSATAETDDAERLFHHLAEPTRQILLHRLESAVAAGQIRPDVDLDAGVDVVISVLMLEALAPRAAGAPARSRGLLDFLLHGLLPSGSRGGTPEARS